MFKLSNTVRRRILHSASYTFLITVGVSMTFPLIWMFVTSVKTPDADVLDPSKIWPDIPSQLTEYDIRNWPVFCRRLIEQGETESPQSPGRRVWQLIKQRPRRTFAEISRKDVTPAKPGRKKLSAPIILHSDISIMLSALNQIIKHSDFYNDSAFKSLVLPTRAQKLLAKRQGDESVIVHLNRLTMEACFPEDIVPTHRFHWENYRMVMVKVNFARAFFNSFFVTIATTFGLVFTSSLAAFAFARLNFAGRDKIFLAYLGTMMIPGSVTMIPSFILIRELQWVNTYQALIIPLMFSAYGTFMLRQFFMGLPRELEEAAVLDGCSTWRVYWHVALPLSRPALAALTILTFMGSWRGFMWPLIVTNTREMFTLPVALAAFKEMYGVQWTLLMTGSVIMIIPLLIVFVFAQRHFISGIRLGGVKG